MKNQNKQYHHDNEDIKVTVKISEIQTFLIWEKHWLKKWLDLDISDKKVLAALYWDDLTDSQKSEFSDKEYIEMTKIQEKKRSEYINDPVKMRQHFLIEAAPLLDEMIKAATGKKTSISKENEFAVREVWNVLKGIIQTANNPAPLLDLKGKEVSHQIDEVLEKVSKGDIDFEQAKDYMSLISSGFNLQKLPELMAKLEALEG